MVGSCYYKSLLLTMKIYSLLSDPGNSALVEAIKKEFPDHHFDFEDGQWFVAANDPSTAREVYEKLDGTDDADIGSVVVVSVGAYYGYASTNLWEWMASRGEA